MIEGKLEEKREVGSQKKESWSRRAKKKVVEHPSKYGWDPLRTTHPPQNPPCSNSTRTKRVSICSFFNTPSIYILTILKKWVAAELWAEQRTPMHTCPSRHPQLACKSINCPPDFTIYNHIIHYRYLGSLNWVAACSPLHPLPPTPLRAWHWLPAMHTDPPLYSNYPKMVPIDSSRAQDFNGVCIIL